MSPLKVEWVDLYQMYADDVNRFLLFLLKKQSDVDDVRQETFIKAYQNWGSFHEKASPKTWILSIARNLAVDKIRKEKRQQRLRQFLPIWSPSQEPEESVLQNERIKFMRNAISLLPPSYQVVVILRGIQELSPFESSQVLNWSVGKVNITYHRALKKLRIFLEESGNDVF